MRALLKLQPFDPDLDKWQEMDGRTFFRGVGGAQTKKTGCQRNDIKKQKLEILVGIRITGWRNQMKYLGKKQRLKKITTTKTLTSFFELVQHETHS